MQEFIDLVNQDLKEGLYNDGDYCIIFYKTQGSNKQVHKIYKNVKDYEKCVSEDVVELNPMYGISFEVWLFDKD